MHYGLSLAWILSFFPFFSYFFLFSSIRWLPVFSPGLQHRRMLASPCSNFTAVDADGEGSAPAISVSASLRGLPIVLLDRKLLHSTSFHVTATTVSDWLCD